MNNNNSQEIKEMKNNIKTSMGYNISEKEEKNIYKTYKKSKGVDKLPPKYSYIPKITAVFSDGTILELLDYINILQFELDLTKYVFTLFSLQLSIPGMYIPKIQFDDNIQFKLELMYKSSEETNPLLYNTLFKVNLTKVKQTSSPINVEGEIYTENIQYTNKQIIELKLIPTQCLDANKVIFSGVYHDCTVLDVMAFMSSKLSNKAFIQQPDNLRNYDQMIFIPYNIFYSLLFMDNYYGIYNRGLKMFYGFDMFRIQSKNYYDQNGTNKIKVNFSNESESADAYSHSYNGLIKLGNDNLINIQPSQVKIVDKRNYIQELIGSNITTFSREDNTIYEQSRNYQLNNNNLNKTKTYINNLNNQIKEIEYFNKGVYTKTLEINLTSIILDVASWFKGFEINFDSSYYNNLNATYTLSNYICRITNNNPGNTASTFNVKSIVVLEEV